MPELPSRSPSQSVYLDTSVLMALICSEPDSARIEDWLAGELGPVVTTPWIRTELAGAVVMKVRLKQMQADVASAVVATGLQVLLTTKCEALRTEDFDVAAELCSVAERSLRGPDALHLSAAKRLGCTHVATLDKVMATVACEIGLDAVDFTPR